MRSFRYNDKLRALDDELIADAKVAEAEAATAAKLAAAPVEADPEAFRRLIDGDTACRDVDDIKAAADASAPQLIAEHQAKQELNEKIASKGAALDALLNRWAVKES